MTAFRRSLAAVAAGRTARQLMAPWQWGLNQGPTWRHWARLALWCLLLAAAGGAAWRWLPPAAARPVAVLLLVLAVVVVFAIHFASLLRLDHPHAARLVPRHAASLGHSALVLWSACCALLGLGSTAVLASADGFGPGLLPLACALAGALLLYVALALRWWVLWVLPFAALFLPALPSGTWRALGRLAGAVDPFPANRWLACAAALLVMAWVLAALPGRGGVRHRRAWVAREHLRRVAEAGSLGHKPTLAAYGPWGERLGRPWQRLADAWLAHATRQGSVMERVDIVIAGSQHWLRQVAVAVPMLAVVAAVLATVVAMGRVDLALVLENGHVGMAVGLLSIGLGPLVSLNAALWFSRREQALLALLPGVPHGARLNRSLGWLRARHFLLLWVLGAVPTAVLAGAAQASHLLALPLVALAGLPVLWNDIAHAPRPGAWAAAWRFLAPLVLGLASMALLREHPAAWAPWLAGVAALSLCAGAWRWRRLARLPSALPAGRLA